MCCSCENPPLYVSLNLFISHYLIFLHYRATAVPKFMLLKRLDISMDRTVLGRAGTAFGKRGTAFGEMGTSGLSYGFLMLVDS
jgi:hypothetical protein